MQTPSIARREGATSAALALGLAVTLVLTKVALLPFPVETAWQFGRYLLRLAIVAAPDVCFVAALGGVCWGVSVALARRPRAGLLWQVAMFGLFYVAGLYGVASVPIYRVTKTPLTVPLISYAGGPVLMGSSIREIVPTGLIVSLCLAPLLLWCAPWIAKRWPWFRAGSPIGWRTALAGGLVVALYGAVCHAYVRHQWTDPNRWERRIAQSPHGVLLASCVTELLLKDRPLTFTKLFPDADASDFTAPAAVAQPPRERTFVWPESKRPKNVVLIVLESTGVEYLGAYGSKFDTTPNLQRLAAERGLAFDNLYVQTPNSCQSLVSLTASVYPSTDWRLMVRDAPDFNVPTVAQVLGERGYRTCFLHAGYWSWKNRDRYLRDRGVQTLIDAETLPQNDRNSWGVSDRAMYQAALDYIDRDPSKPFYLLAYTIETHHPYVSPPRPHDFGVADEEQGRYLNALRQADAHIAWLVDELDRRGLADDTLVAVTADHGESFGQHDQRVHSFGVYEPDVHVPLILLHPALAGGPRRSEALAQHIDIPATLLASLGVEQPPQWQGRDLMSTAPRERTYFYSTGNEIILGLREGSWKYHYYVDSDREELFDLSADAGELKNLAGKEIDRCQGYRRRVGGLVEHQRRFLKQHGMP